MKSKFKLVVGQDQKLRFSKAKLAKTVTEGRAMAANGNYLAICWDTSNGGVVVKDATNPCGIAPPEIFIKGHTVGINDIKFSPIRSDFLSTSGGDGKVNLWQIPQGGLTESLNDPLQSLSGHQKSIVMSAFNPSCAEVISSISLDKTCKVWDMSKGDCIYTNTFGDNPTSLDWNFDGSLVGVASKDKYCYILDPRKNAAVAKFKSFDSPKISKLAFIDDNYFITCGFDGNKRTLKHYDMRKIEVDTFSKEVANITIDNQFAVMTPFVDPNNKLVFLNGKGDRFIHYFDCKDGMFTKIDTYSSNEPSTTISMFEPRNMDYNKLELARFAKAAGKDDNLDIIYVSFTYPKKTPVYDPEYYPNVPACEPALTYDQWIAGENKPPVTKPIDQIENKFVSAPTDFVKKAPEPVKKEMGVEEIKEENKKLKEENEKLKKENEELKGKIAALEEENNKLKETTA